MCDDDYKKKSITVGGEHSLDPRVELDLVKKCDHLIGKKVSKVSFKLDGRHVVFSVFTEDGFEFYSFLDRDKVLGISND